MRKTFIIATTGDRLQGLKNLLISLYPFFNSGWKAVIVCQAYSNADIVEIKKLVGENGLVVAIKELIGAHTAKVIALNAIQSDIWCSLDDDMFAIKQTDYEKMSDILENDKSIGFISGNWARTVGLAGKKSVQDKLISQKLVFTGGGLMFREDVAEIIRNIPNEQYLFDDCLWAMYAYIHGYSNYRYLGSIAIHQICTVGGRRTWLKLKPNRVLPPEKFLRVRKGTKDEGYNQYLICNDSDLTELSHRLHLANKKEK